MESIPLKDLLYILSSVVAVVITFYTTKHNLKDFMRDKMDECNNKVNCK